MFAYCLGNPVCMLDSLGTDAIYVSKTSGENSLKVFGHAILYFQGPDGKWYETHYIGPSKPEAKVLIREANMDVINKMLNGDEIEGTRYTYISGDFSAGLDLAKNMKEQIMVGISFF